VKPLSGARPARARTASRGSCRNVDRPAAARQRGRAKACAM